MTSQINPTISLRIIGPIALGIAIILLPALGFALGYHAYPILNGLATSQEVSLNSLASARLDPPDSDGTSLDAIAAESIVNENAPARDELFREAWTILEQDFFGEKPDITKRTYGMLHGLLGTYNDPYTFFVEPQPRQLERDELRGSFGGIGAEIIQEKDGFTLRPLRDQPAAHAGILEGDRLVQVDATPITAKMTVDDVVALIRGELGTDVTLIVRRRVNAVAVAAREALSDTTSLSGQELTLIVTRAEIRTPSMDWRLLDDTPETATIGYIQHRIFSERSPDEMRLAIAELLDGGADRFIIDLRGNPGGLVDSVIKIANMWLEQGIIMQEKKADGSEKVFRANNDALVPDVPLVLIVDGGSASASEILAGALQDHGRAQLVGEKTFGKGSVQLIRELTDHSSLHVTNALWFTPNGHRIDGEGLQPDVLIEPGNDPVPTAIEAVQAIDAK